MAPATPQSGTQSEVLQDNFAKPVIQGDGGSDPTTHDKSESILPQRVSSRVPLTYAAGGGNAVYAKEKVTAGELICGIKKPHITIVGS